MSRAVTMQPMDEAAAAGRLALQHCTACGTGQYPPRELCRACLSDQMAWTVEDAVPGQLLAQTSVQHSFVPETPVPQRIGLVRLSMGETAVCFLDAEVEPGAVAVRAHLDSLGRAVLLASPC
jgi:uncharacterized OB-fold protein